MEWLDAGSSVFVSVDQLGFAPAEEGAGPREGSQKTPLTNDSSWTCSESLPPYITRAGAGSPPHRAPAGIRRTGDSHTPLASARGLSTSSSPCSFFCSHSYQSSPISSQGCGVRTVPFPQHMSSAGQNFSHPQQIRSGFLGCIGNLAIAMFWAESKLPLLSRSRTSVAVT